MIQPKVVQVGKATDLPRDRAMEFVVMQHHCAKPFQAEKFRCQRAGEQIVVQQKMFYMIDIASMIK